MANSEIQHPGIEFLRSSAEREAMRRSSGLQHRALEELLAAGEGRKQVLLATSAYVFEMLPKVMASVVEQALKGNLSAGKLLLDIAGLQDTLAETVSAHKTADTGAPIEMEFLQTLRSRIESLPQTPDPLETP